MFFNCSLQLSYEMLYKYNQINKYNNTTVRKKYVQNEANQSLFFESIQHKDLLSFKVQKC